MSKYLLGILVAAVAFQFFILTPYGSAGEPYGFLVTGENVQRTQGFQKNVIYLTKEEMEALKLDKNPKNPRPSCTCPALWSLQVLRQCKGISSRWILILNQDMSRKGKDLWLF